jgi:hypothetical protein
MIESLTILLTMAVAACVVAGVLLFLPALIELKIPKDAGPRLITDSGAIASISQPITEIFDCEGGSNSLEKNSGLSQLMDVDV